MLKMKKKLSIQSFFLPILLMLCSTFGAEGMNIKSVSPVDGSRIASLNPRLSVEIDNISLSDITFSLLSDNGVWQEIARYQGVPAGSYAARPSGIRERDTTYVWKVSVVSEGKSIEEEYGFSVVDYIGEAVTPIGRATCWKYGYIRRGRTPGRFYVTTQTGFGRGGAAYDVDRGWYETFFDTPRMGHASWGYWDSQYHAIGGTQGGTHIAQVSSETFTGFQNMDRVRHGRKIGAYQKSNWPETSTYTFNNHRAWIMAIDYHEDTERGDVRYWEWTKEAEDVKRGWRGQGWSDPVTIGDVLSHTGHVSLLQIDRDNWCLYVVEGADEKVSTMKYFKSGDAGRTWSGLNDTGIPAHPIWSHVSFARYGDNYHVFLIESDTRETVIYQSSDGITWDPESRKVLETDINPARWMKSRGTMLNQSALIYTSNRNRFGEDDQYGFIVPVSEMLAGPGLSLNPHPGEGSIIASGVSEVSLEVGVKGDQVYDVAFYLADGTFIEIDRLLKEGDTASVKMPVEPGQTYSWYAISRGATVEYYGEPDSTSDEAWTDIFSFTVQAESD